MRAVPVMTQRNVGLGRIAPGAAYVAFPRLLTRPWTGIAHRRVDALGRAIGIRDLALGLGALVTLRRGVSARGWLEAAALSDAVDALATLVVFRELPVRSRWAILAAAITGATVSARASTYRDLVREATVTTLAAER
jgi:hypothetical protein